ncbi:MFS transporter [Cutibacterium sp.]|uniref:MFS transporter n=1 Tax=Cutibacterium sp. TaxID=1912221 RepID=UPI0026DB295A|nr:MFS transporter [Cutibacterium sp.]MDO4411677.1 MFS transporter [Cutibacterium sp.]
MAKRSSGLLIAVSVVILELIGGMQSYLNQLILPIMAQDLDAQSSYGVVLGVSTIASMAGLPIGAALMNRILLSRLLLSATALLVVGAVTSALAPHIVVYIMGAFIRGLAGSILAMTSIGAVALGLSGRARQLTLAFSSASWVISSVVGPTYAAWVTHLLSWRWAMILYLPLLILARIVVALNLKNHDTKNDAPLSLVVLFLIITGVGLTIIPAAGAFKIILLLLGLVILGRAAVLLMPEGTFIKRTPRRAALSGMFFLTGSYFVANELVSLTVHDIFHVGAESLGYILTGGGLAWAVLGVFCGAKPATTKRSYRIRSSIGMALLVTSSSVIVAWLVFQWGHWSPTVVFVILWSTAGVGMGLTYLDTMNIFFEDPAISDGITIEEMASSSVIVESLSSTMFIPLTTSIVAMAFNDNESTGRLAYEISWVIVVMLACVAVYYLKRAEPARS